MVLFLFLPLLQRRMPSIAKKMIEDEEHWQMLLQYCCPVALCVVGVVRTEGVAEPPCFEVWNVLILARK